MSSAAPRLVSTLVTPRPFFGAAQILVGIFLAIDSRRPFEWLIGVAMSLCALVLTWQAIRAASTRVTAAGISQLTWRGRLQLAFADVTGITKKPGALILSGRLGRVVVPVGAFENTDAAIEYLESRLPSGLAPAA